MYRWNPCSHINDETSIGLSKHFMNEFLLYYFNPNNVGCQQNLIVSKKVTDMNEFVYACEGAYCIWVYKHSYTNVKPKNKNLI